jgi:hypothetical protein
VLKELKELEEHRELRVYRELQDLELRVPKVQQVLTALMDQR